MKRAFSHEDYASIVREFSTQVVGMLSRHPETADLAIETERLHLDACLRHRFTVAIIGQMRVGKSTLLNALIGRDLAPTGITETTATINWFKQDTGGLEQVFRAHWNDGSQEDFPLEQISEWLGESEHARRTRCVDFFAGTDFVRDVNVVDTPGLRSVLEAHEEATQTFLGDRLEEATLAHGARADAVVYVINPVGRESDVSALDMFGDRSRIPGASPYNSIAVVQKWETLGPEEARRKCQRLAQQLDGKVAEVLPTSGLLARTAMTVHLSHWDNVAKLTELSKELRSELAQSGEFFSDDTEGVPLDRAARIDLRAIFRWEVLHFVLSFGPVAKSGEALRTWVYASSGIEQLEAVLRRRFFARSGLIKAGTVLKKAYGPCNSALIRMEQALAGQAKRISEGITCRDQLVSKLRDDSTLKPTIDYLNSIVEKTVADKAHMVRTYEKLDVELARVKSNFESLDDDLRSLEILDRLEEALLTDAERRELKVLFGACNSSAAGRLGFDFERPVGTEQLEPVYDRLDHWSALAITGRSADLRRVATSARKRLEELLEHFES